MKTEGAGRGKKSGKSRRVGAREEGRGERGGGEGQGRRRAGRSVTSLPKTSTYATLICAPTSCCARRTSVAAMISSHTRGTRPRRDTDEPRRGSAVPSPNIVCVLPAPV